MTHHLVFCCVNHIHQCNFGPEDKSDVVPDDMQALLRSTQKQRKNKMHDQNKIKWKKGSDWVVKVVMRKQCNMPVDGAIGP